MLDLNKGDRAKILSPALAKVGTVVIVLRPHTAGYIVRLPDRRTEFALPEELAALE